MPRINWNANDFAAICAEQPDVHPAQAIMRGLGSGERHELTLEQKRAAFIKISGLSPDHRLFPKHLR